MRNLIKEEIAEATQNKHFSPNLETRIKCDASRKGLGCALEQRTPDGWHTVAFNSRFLNSTEERYSMNERELLGVTALQSSHSQLLLIFDESLNLFAPF